MQIGRFNDTHRVMADVISLIHLLAYRLPHGGTVLGDLLANAEQLTVRIEATGAPFERRGVLKARGYRWDARARVWWSEIAEVDLEDEKNAVVGTRGRCLGHATDPADHMARATSLTGKRAALRRRPGFERVN